MTSRILWDAELPELDDNLPIRVKPGMLIIPSPAWERQYSVHPYGLLWKVVACIPARVISSMHGDTGVLCSVPYAERTVKRRSQLDSFLREFPKVATDRGLLLGVNTRRTYVVAYDRMACSLRAGLPSAPVKRRVVWASPINRPDLGALIALDCIRQLMLPPPYTVTPSPSQVQRLGPNHQMTVTRLSISPCPPP